MPKVPQKDVDEKLLEHWSALHSQGVQLTKDRIKALEDAGIIQPEHKQYETPKPRRPNRIRREMSLRSKQEMAADAHLDVIMEVDADVATFMDVVKDKMWDDSVKEYAGGKKIEKRHWIPWIDSPFEPDEDFVKLIDSIIRYGFSNRINNRKYNLYKQQAKDWLASDESVTDYFNPQDKVAFVKREAERCRTNTLYALNKHLWLKEDSEYSGIRKFEAYDCQAFVLYVLDCGFSALIGKLRQIGFSTVIGAAAEMRARVTKNFFVKFIAENDRKTEEIFEDKIKYPLTQAPAWFRPTVHNDAANLLTYVNKKKKGKATGLNSKIMVEPPYLTAINGGSPSLVLMDEIGQIDILSGIILEGRPTLFYVEPRSRKMKVRRQFIGWGTAGETDKGGGDFEKEFRTAMKNWQERNFRYGIVPIFIDAFSKPGVDKEFYEAEKRAYYDRAEANAVKGEEIKAQFHTAYPIDVEDMFLTRAKTLVSVAVINKNLGRIRGTLNQKRPKFGYFEPMFDESVPMGDTSDVPYRIIGANFVPTEDFSEAATATIYHEPDLTWKMRYFQGTDPISSETGYSKFASSIWDEVDKTIPANINFRVPNHRYCYQQAMLMNLYYGKPMHLVEYNIGAEMIAYIEAHRHDTTIMRKDFLLKILQSGAAPKGIRKTPGNSIHINNKLLELIELYMDYIDVEDFFVQLKTYTEKMSKNGHTSYGVSNPVYFNDDNIDSIVYAYIAAQSYARFSSPKSPEEVVGKKRKMKLGYDDNYRVIVKNGYMSNKRIG